MEDRTGVPWGAAATPLDKCLTQDYSASGLAQTNCGASPGGLSPTTYWLTLVDGEHPRCYKGL